MSSQASRQQMMDDGLGTFADSARLDPGTRSTALSLSAFSPPRAPIFAHRDCASSMYPAIAVPLELRDLHPYPIVLSLTMDQAAQNYGFSLATSSQKPISWRVWGINGLTICYRCTAGCKAGNSVLAPTIQRLAALDVARTNNRALEWAIQRRSHHLSLAPHKAKPCSP